MLLRPRQTLFVERADAALRAHGNTLGIAPTGAGKTIIFSALAGRLMDGNDAKALVLAHRDELVSQNLDKFGRVNPTISGSVVDAERKDWSGRATFAMAETLCRPGNLADMPTLDLMVIDEAHHAVADTWKRITDAVLSKNPACRIFGVTATPNRSDKKGLRPIFSNVADQISIGELVASGHLVRPRTFVIDVGVREALTRVRRTASDFDMGAVAGIMNRPAITEAVIGHWKERAGDRQTAIFCSTVEHAQAVAAAFNAAGVSTAAVFGSEHMSKPHRADALAAYARRDVRVIVNVAVLGEGWDDPPTSCIGLLRPHSAKGTMIQMIGRGLRPIDPELYPGIVKTDCLVLDFGVSSLLHGTLEQDVDLIGRAPISGEAPTKNCPECDAELPVAVRECPFCGYDFMQDHEAPTPLADFAMREIDLLTRSNFAWESFQDDTLHVASGIDAYAVVVLRGGVWIAIGGLPKRRAALLAIGDRLVCEAAGDDWMNENETSAAMHKTRAWLRDEPSEKQLAYLPPHARADPALTRYRASAFLACKFNAPAIQSALKSAAPTPPASPRS